MGRGFVWGKTAEGQGLLMPLLGQDWVKSTFGNFADWLLDTSLSLIDDVITNQSQS